MRFLSGGVRRKPDKREGRCYTEIEERGGQKRCHHEMGSAVSKATCCCSMGKAWGARCESCPKADTEEYKTLCPGGTGYRPNPSTVSGAQNHVILVSVRTAQTNAALLVPAFTVSGDLGGRERVRGTRQPVQKRPLHQHVRQLHVFVRRGLPAGQHRHVLLW